MRRIFVLILFILFLVMTSIALLANEENSFNSAENLNITKMKWSIFQQSGYVHQFDTDIDDGGSFGMDSFFVEGGLSYGRFFSIGLGYGFDSYKFSGTDGLASQKPWKNIHSLRLSTPFKFPLNREKKLISFVIPTIRFAIEDNGKIPDSIFGGGLAGLAWKVSEKLTIGPGFGLITNIKDDPSIFPILLIDWKITDTLFFKTGKGLGATMGPGLFMTWKANEKFSLLLGSRYEKFRFRLNENGPVPNGIGQDKSIPVLCGATYKFNDKTKASLFTGVEFAGKLKLEDREGNKLAEEKYDPSVVIGLSFNISL